MKKLIITAFFLTGALGLWAQQPQGALDAEMLKKANDPMANTKAFNLHNYIIPSIYGEPDMFSNQLMFRYAQPIGKFLVRGTLPVVTVAQSDSPAESGLGDFSLFAIYTWEFGGNKIGVGPLMAAPTATKDMFGQGKWQAGLSAMAFFANNHIIQYGTLLQWQADFAGDEDRAHVNLLTAQLFGTWQIGGGTYLRSTGIWSFDLENNVYNIPVGLGIGKVIKVNNVVFNIFAEPQFSVYAKGTGGSRFQTFVGFNTQF
ncbi:MAG: hypothetical protein LBV43_04595 [Prevotella sp.]|jgi:hypothetical protein|nr:hypothetical protein [Prevotella sp.]